MAKTGYFLVADVLGFGRMILNAPEGTLDERIIEWVSLVQISAKAANIESFQLISDTVFASAPPSAEGLNSLIQFSQFLIADGLARFFPIRGAIVYGDFEWGDLTYGRAVVQAHDLEMSQNWIGIACEPGMPNVSALWHLDKLVCYIAPKKRGLVQAGPVVSWPVPPTEEFVSLIMKSNSVKDGESLSWEIMEKISNTIQFRLYVQILRQTGSSPSEFHGFFPAHALDHLRSKASS